MKRTPAKKTRKAPKKAPRKAAPPSEKPPDEPGDEFVRFPRKILSVTSGNLSGYGLVGQLEFEQGDQLAPFNFAALYFRWGGHPSDIPEWVAHYFVKAVGEWALNNQAGKTPLDEIMKKWKNRGKALWGFDEEWKYLSRKKNYIKSAKAAIKAKGGSTFTDLMEGEKLRPGLKKIYSQDEKKILIPENTFLTWWGICRVLDKRLKPTKDFQVMLARQCGITGRSRTRNKDSDDAIYQALKQIEKRHRTARAARRSR